jgi:hypothetical protein
MITEPREFWSDMYRQPLNMHAHERGSEPTYEWIYHEDLLDRRSSISRATMRTKHRWALLACIAIDIARLLVVVVVPHRLVNIETRELLRHITEHIRQPQRPGCSAFHCQEQCPG